MIVAFHVRNSIEQNLKITTTKIIETIHSITRKIPCLCSFMFIVLFFHLCLVCVIDCPALSASVTNVANSTNDKPSKKSKNKQSNGDDANVATCCNCFGTTKHWTDAVSLQMSDAYCRTCDSNIESTGNNAEDNDINSPACLTRVTGKRGGNGLNGVVNARHLLSVESELEVPDDALAPNAPASPFRATATAKPKTKPDRPTLSTYASNTMPECQNDTNTNNNGGQQGEEYELANDATNGDLSDDVVRINVMNEADEKRMVRVHGREELPAEQQTSPESPSMRSPKYKYFDKTHLMNEIACIKEETKCMDNESAEQQQQIIFHPSNRNPIRPSETNSNEQAIDLTSTEDSDELANKIALDKNGCLNEIRNNKSNYVNCTDDHPLMAAKDHSTDDVHPSKTDDADIVNGNAVPALKRHLKRYATLPRIKKTTIQQMVCMNNAMKQVPTRITPDGTTIYYWCDLSKDALKGYYLY